MTTKKRFLLMIVVAVTATAGAFDAAAQNKYYLSPNNKNQNNKTQDAPIRPPVQNNQVQNTPSVTPALAPVFVQPAPPPVLVAPPPEAVPNAVLVAPCTEDDQNIAAAFMRKIKEIERASKSGDRDELMKFQKFVQDSNGMMKAQDAMMRCAAVQAMANYYAAQSGAKQR